MPSPSLDDAPELADWTVRINAGDTAVLAFRTQIFVTRSTVAITAGLSTRQPRLTGLYDAQGRAL